MKTFKVLAHPEGVHFDEVEEVILSVNALQTYFHCELVSACDLLSAEGGKVNAEQLTRAIGERFPEERIIAITESHYDTELVLEERLPYQILVTCAEWEEEEAPSRAIFLLHSLASSLLTFEARLSAEENRRMGHTRAVGCLFDWWDGPEQLAVILVCARLCERCERRLAIKHGVQPEAFSAVNKILDHARRHVLGQHPQIPTKVFVAHGWSADWKDLETILNDLRVPVVEFEGVAVAGRVIPDRWKEMLDQSRFAFALLTPDEKVGQEKRLPRPNVIHEIGLCQGRLGLGSTVVLREKSVESISNLQGVIDIEFETGKLAEQRGKIERVLRERGLLR